MWTATRSSNSPRFLFIFLSLILENHILSPNPELLIFRLFELHSNTLMYYAIFYTQIVLCWGEKQYQSIVNHLKSHYLINDFPHLNFALKRQNSYDHFKAFSSYVKEDLYIPILYTFHFGLFKNLLTCNLLIDITLNWFKFAFNKMRLSSKRHSWTKCTTH